jgi:hypothetical protein
MARQFGGDLYDFENMSDDEIRDVVLEHLREYPNLDADDIEVAVKDGTVTLSGRVGTDAEVQVAGAVLDDVLGLDDFSNDLVVDELRRGEAPAAADDAIAADEEVDEVRGGSDPQQSDTAEHLVENLEEESFGTHDPSRATRDATTYIPPERPVSDGYGSREEH